MSQHQATDYLPFHVVLLYIYILPSGFKKKKNNLESKRDNKYDLEKISALFFVHFYLALGNPISEEHT